MTRKEKNNTYNKAYYAANMEKELARHKAYYESNREKIAARKKARRKAWGEANRENETAQKKAWREANRGKYNESCAKRRALKLKAIPEHIRECPFEKNRLIQIYKLRELMTEITGIQHHVDHMWPLSKGGPHWSGNLQVIPASENLSKNDKLCRETRGVIKKTLSNFVSERSI